MNTENLNVDLQKKLLQLDRQLIIEVYRDLKINSIDEKASDRELVEKLLEKIDKSQIEEFNVILNYYLQLHSLLVSLTKDYLFELISPEKRGRLKKKDDFINRIKDLIIHKEITIEEIKKRIEEIKKTNENEKILSNILEKYQTFEDLKSFADNLGEKVDGLNNKADLCKKIKIGLDSGKYSSELIEKYIGEIKTEDIKLKSSKDTGELLKQIEFLKTHILSIEEEVKSQKIALLSFNNNLERTQEITRSNSNLIKSYFDKIEVNFNINRTEKLIAALRRENLSITKVNSQSFDSLKDSLKKDNISDIDILRDGLAVMILDYVMKLTKEMEWDINLDSFYRILSEEITTLGGTSNFSAKIPIVRDLLCKKMNIIPNKFDSMLLDCREKGWVLLEVGTPIGETEAGWLDTGKNRFYYVKLRRK